MATQNTQSAEVTSRVKTCDTRPASGLAPIEKRCYLSGMRGDYNVLLKDNSATVVIWRMPVPYAAMGHTIVRSIRAYARENNGRLFT